MVKRIIKLKEENAEKNISLFEAMELFQRYKSAQGVAELTQRDYRNTFKGFKTFSSNSFNLSILKREVLEYLTTKSDGSPTKFNKPYAVLKCFFSWAMKQGLIDKNPIDVLDLKKKRDEPRIRSIAVERIRELLSVMNLKTYIGLRDYTITLLMMDCGMRPKEIFSLEIKDLALDSNTITVSKYVAKTRRTRILPLSQSVVDLMEKLIKVKPTEWKNDLIFCSYDGQQMTTATFGQRLKRYGKQTGVKITPYDLRHCFATLYLQNNGNVFALQKTMGHSNLNMTKRYVDVNDCALKEQHFIASPVNQLMKRNTRINKIEL